MAEPLRPQTERQTIVLPFAHGAVTADTGPTKLFAVPAGQTWRLKRVQYVNPTGLAQDAANYFVLSIKQSSALLAKWSTLTGVEGTLTADTFVEWTLSATDADLVLEPTDEIVLLLDETGTASLPAGSGNIFLERIQ